MADHGTGRLTTHVLDTARGMPAAGLVLTLYRIDAEGGYRTAAGFLKQDVTNADGRCEAPLLSGEAFLPGIYELVFEAGRYFDAAGYDLAEPKFLDAVTVRFGLSAPAHVHVPLLLSPFGYSTYRGS